MNRHSLQLSVLPEALQASNSILVIQFFSKPFSIEMRSSFSIRDPCSSHEDLAIVDRKNCSDRNSFPVGFLRFCLLLGGQQACTGSCQILLTPNMAKSPCPHQADTAHHFCKSKHPCLPPHPCPSLQRVCAAQLKIRPYPGQCFRRQTLQTHFCKLDKRQNVLPTYTRKFNVDEKSFFLHTAAIYFMLVHSPKDLSGLLQQLHSWGCSGCFFHPSWYAVLQCFSPLTSHAWNPSPDTIPGKPPGTRLFGNRRSACVLPQACSVWDPGIIYSNYVNFQAPLLGLFDLINNCINSRTAVILDSASSFPYASVMTFPLQRAALWQLIFFTGCFKKGQRESDCAVVKPMPLWQQSPGWAHHGTGAGLVLDSSSSCTHCHQPAPRSYGQKK